MNEVILIGRLTKDPELRRTNTGTSLCGFTLAVDNYKKDGTKGADFIRCKAFSKTAETLCQYMRKGSKIGLQGQIKTGSYQDQNGQTVYTTDVVANHIEFLESNKGQSQQQGYQGGFQQPNQYQQQNYQQPQTNYQQPYEELDVINSDDLPF